MPSSEALAVAPASDAAPAETLGPTARSRGVTGTLLFLAAGGVSGATAKTVVAPLERTKIMLQVDAMRPGSSFQGIGRTIRGMVEREGVRGLWAGNGTNMIRIIPYAAIQFAAHERYKQLLMRDGETTLPAGRRLCAGSLAGITAVAFTYPLDLVRTRLAAQDRKEHYTSMRHAFVTIHRREGPRAFLKGLYVTVLGIIPYAGINFFTYETLKIYLPKSSNGEPTTTSSLAAGAAAGLLGQTITYPLDVVRRRMQMAGLFANAPTYASLAGALRTIVAKEGLQSLFRGLSINYLRVVPSVSVSFTVYNYLKQELGLVGPAR